MGDPPTRSHTLERIDNDKGYHPGNVKWATYKEQNRNHRRNRVISFRGKTMVLTDWANHLGINYATLEKRFRMGWSIKDALTKPVDFSYSRTKKNTESVTYTR